MKQRGHLGPASALLHCAGAAAPTRGAPVPHCCAPLCCTPLLQRHPGAGCGAPVAAGSAGRNHRLAAAGALLVGWTQLNIAFEPPGRVPLSPWQCPLLCSLSARQGCCAAVLPPLWRTALGMQPFAALHASALRSRLSWMRMRCCSAMMRAHPSPDPSERRPDPACLWARPAAAGCGRACWKGFAERININSLVAA